MASGGGVSHTPTADEALRRRVNESIWNRDHGEFMKAMPKAKAERDELLRKTFAFQNAIGYGALPTVRQILEWDPGALRALDSKTVIHLLGQVTGTWRSVRNSQQMGWPVRNPPPDGDFVEIVRMLLDTKVWLGGAPNPALANLMSMAPSAEANRVARWLLERGASIERMGPGSRSPLSLAIQNRNDEMGALMLDLRKPSQEALDEALVYSSWWDKASIALPERLLSLGANINVDGKAFGAAFEPVLKASWSFAQRKEREPLLLAIRYRADPNRHSTSGDSPLMNVVHDHELMEGLLKLGANPDYRDYHGKSAMVIAVSTPEWVVREVDDRRPLAQVAPSTDPAHRARSVSLLLQYGANPNLASAGELTPVMRTRDGDDAAIEALMAKGARVVLPAQLRTMYAGRGTPIGPVSWALAQHNDSLASALLRRDGADSREDCGALYYAVEGGAVRAASLLIDAKATREFRLPDGSTPRLLLAAASSGNLELVKLLLDRRVVDINETSPTMWSKGPGEVYGVLAAPLFGSYQGSGGGENALMMAAAGGHVEIVKELVRRGIDVRHRTATGAGALDYARNENGGEIGEILRAHGLK
ncbi:MAG: hypothetical protein FIB05_08470 [Betaproteobacteria bacterium]|nr:hypothetical protein [Betaproteobacteria bacterium]PWB60896.1 MAG: hypothetical protein C3F16_09600 [Betaproteobacteria bacterium]